MCILMLILVVYISILMGTYIGILTTDFVVPKGLWKLVPFRVSGWLYDSKYYSIKWIYSKIDWSKYELI